MASSNVISNSDGMNGASAISYHGPRLILGTSAISSANSKDLPALLHSLSNLPIPITSIDTAPFYPLQRPGYVESLLGSALESSGLSHDIDTKTMVSPKNTSTPGAGELHHAKITETTQGSVHRLKKSKLRTLFAARPDHEATVAEIAGVFSAKVHEGLVEQWGICDFSATSLKDLVRAADKHGWHGPKVYQGRYSALHRKKAEQILDVVEEQNMVFVASHAPSALRSNPASSTKGTAKLNVFDMPEVAETVEVLKAIEDMHKLTPRAASLRWLAYHSRLRPDDGLILEPATLEELRSDVGEIAKGPLPGDVLKEVDRAWQAEEEYPPDGR